MSFSNRLTDDQTISVWPVPFIDEINIQLDKLPEYNLTYELFDVLGKSIKSGVLNNTNVKVSSTNILKGFYFLSIKTNEKNIIKTFSILKL